MSLHSASRQYRRLACWLFGSLAFWHVAPALPEHPPSLSNEPESYPAAAPSLSQPTVGHGFSPVERFQLEAAFDAAVRRLRESDGCRALFDGLKLAPLPALADTLYEPARGALASAYCRGAVVALTVVNGQRTRLCEPFRRLSRRDKANVLIHEALHRAGLGESPLDPAAPTAREIRGRVSSACGL